MVHSTKAASRGRSNGALALITNYKKIINKIIKTPIVINRNNSFLGCSLSWVMRWALPNTALMRQNSIFNQTIYIGNVQDEALNNYYRFF
jgi:hypothetical protein